MNQLEFVQRFAESIANMEGFYKKGSLAQRNNNPGNLRSWGTRPTLKGFALFDTPEQGWKALRSQIAKNIARKLTMHEFFAGKEGGYGGYAPAADKNNPRKYAVFVARNLGIDPDERLDVVLSKLNDGTRIATLVT